MSKVSSTFSKSKTNQIINFILEKYGGEGDYDEVINTLLQTPDAYDKKDDSTSTLIKPSKGKGKNNPTNSQTNSEKKRGQSKWTAFQKWCKIFGVIHGYKLGRATTKAIWEAEGKSWQDLWQPVADQLNNGIDIREVENKPDIEPIYKKVLNITQVYSQESQESQISQPEVEEPQESQISQPEVKEPQESQISQPEDPEIAELREKLAAAQAANAAA